MTNNAYHKLCREFQFMYNNVGQFHTYCHMIGIMHYVPMYSIYEASTDDMKKARAFWKKNKLPWFAFYDDMDAYNEGHDIIYTCVGSYNISPEEDFKIWCKEHNIIIGTSLE